MKHILVQPNYRISPKIEEELTLRAQTLVFEPAKGCGLSLERMGFAPVILKPQVFEGPEHRWEVYPVADDPALRAGKLAAPKSVIQDLATLTEAGVHFDMVLVAHEKPLPGQQLDDSLLAPVVAMKRGLKLAAAMTAEGIKGTAGALGNLAVAPVIAFGSFAASFMTMLVLDPALIGVIVPGGEVKEGAPGLFVLIAAWED